MPRASRDRQDADVMEDDGDTFEERAAAFGIEIDETGGSTAVFQSQRELDAAKLTAGATPERDETTPPTT
jgi:hypothetical protein